MEEIRNKVAESGLITLDMADYFPKESILSFDIKEYLWQGFALKEKDFRDHLKNHNWSQYQDKYVSVFCSEDAIIQSWAYMLIGSYLEGIAKDIHFGPADKFEQELLVQNLSNMDLSEFTDERIIVKGCGDKHISNAAYLKISHILKPVVKSLMFGEACSSVPVYKKAR